MNDNARRRLAFKTGRVKGLLAEMSPRRTNKEGILVFGPVSPRTFPVKVQDGGHDKNGDSSERHQTSH